MVWATYDWLNKDYSFFYMAAVVVIDGGCGLRIEARVVETNLIRVSYRCISCYFHIKIPFKWQYTSNKTECFSYKSGCGRRRCMRIEMFKRRAGLGYR